MNAGPWCKIHREVCRTKKLLITLFNFLWRSVATPTPTTKSYRWLWNKNSIGFCQSMTIWLYGYILIQNTSLASIYWLVAFQLVFWPIIDGIALLTLFFSLIYSVLLAVCAERALYFFLQALVSHIVNDGWVSTQCSNRAYCGSKRGDTGIHSCWISYYIHKWQESQTTTPWEFHLGKFKFNVRLRPLMFLILMGRRRGSC